MKFYSLIFISAVLITSPSIALEKTQACSHSSSMKNGHEEKAYVCPMHPQVIGEKGDSCPICGMALVHEDEKDRPHEHSH